MTDHQFRQARRFAEALKKPENADLREEFLQYNVAKEDGWTKFLLAHRNHQRWHQLMIECGLPLNHYVPPHIVLSTAQIDLK